MDVELPKGRVEMRDASGGERMQEVDYRGGLLRFRVLAAWVVGVVVAIACLAPCLVDEDGVEPTINTAERALRPAVLCHTGSFGTQSDSGACFVEHLLTVTATCKQQGRSVLDYVTTVCAAAQLAQSIPSLLPVAA